MGRRRKALTPAKTKRTSKAKTIGRWRKAYLVKVPVMRWFDLLLPCRFRATPVLMKPHAAAFSQFSQHAAPDKPIPHDQFKSKPFENSLLDNLVIIQMTKGQ